jgi:hypothetical protein
LFIGHFFSCELELIWFRDHGPHFNSLTEFKLAAQSGRGTDDLVEDAIAGYFDEVLQIRETLSSRYDDLKSDRVKPIDGEEAFTRLKAKTEAERNRPA